MYLSLGTMSPHVSLFVTAILCWTAVLGQQAFRLSNIYADDMVLQQAPKSSHIWGYGAVGSEVSITLVQQEFKGTTGADGKWSVRLPATKAGGPYQLDIKYTPPTGNPQSSTLKVWFGDVWVCGGQSNMQMEIFKTFNSSEETLKALNYQNLRLMLINMQYSDTELDEIPSIGIPWSAPTEANVPNFSALCLMFGERLSDSLGGRPIGLIASTWWGTPIEAWSSTRVTTFCNTPTGTMEGDQNKDHVLWNAMIHPIIPLAVRGAIWYQGEQNAGYNQDLYPCHIQRLIGDWQNSFVDGNVPVPEDNGFAFPFGIVQIGPWSQGVDQEYGSVRLHQTVDQGVLPNVFLPNAFMAASYDTTDPDSPTGDIHPRDKQTIADRLANSAKALLYDEQYSMYGPVPVSIEETTPGVISITYDVDISVMGTTGFTYRLRDDSWNAAAITSVQGRTITVAIDSGATHLSYGFLGVVCDYMKASIYSSNQERLPAQIWFWSLSNVRATI